MRPSFEAVPGALPWSGQTARGRLCLGTTGNWKHYQLSTLLEYVCNPELLPFALQFLSELQSTCDVAKISQLVVDPVVVNLLEVVQPNLGQSHGVLLENIGARSPLVRRS